uniref:YqaJ viral recombinase domain-containing protein n=1 Tax=Cyprinodon variegatus TaxID=28743 RepID=A0A3Q2FXY2_CYPVA
MLFKLEATIRCSEKTTVTGEPAYWMIPNNINKVGAEVGHKIDFTSSKAKRKSLDQLLDGQAEHMPAFRTVTSTCTGNTSTQDQWSAYLRELQKASSKAAVLSCVPGFCDSFADTLQPCPAPDSLSRLRDTKMDCSDLSALRLHCRTLLKKADISQDQAHYIEMQSRSQHRSSTWYRFRTGRVTASTMYAVFRSDLDNPAVSTVKAVCGTNSGATNHCAATYKQKMEKQHCDFELSQSGFIINPKFPQVGASPDAIVLCTCCGKGCVKIKCPFKYQDTTILEACKSGDKNFCLEMVDGKLQLKKEHPYYKQVQTQIFVANAAYSDFVVWTLKEIVVLRVAPDPKLWNALLGKAQQFFERVCLPELKKDNGEKM